MTQFEMDFEHRAQVESEMHEDLTGDSIGTSLRAVRRSHPQTSWKEYGIA